MDIEVQEPYLLLRGLNVVDLEDLLEDIKVYREMEADTNTVFWSVRRGCWVCWVGGWVCPGFMVVAGLQDWVGVSWFHGCPTGHDHHLQRGDLEAEEIGGE